MTRAAQSTALQGFLPTEPTSGESGERSSHGREREELDVLVPGAVVAGKYRVRGELGRGGFAVVYDAEHLDLRRDVALKVLHRTDGTPGVLIERFAREVRISALVRHPNVLEVFDAGALPDGSPFLVMENIKGETLHQHVCLAKKLSIRDTIELSRQLLEALVALAEHGVVHRDIKPENMMLTRDEAGELKLKLLDFGIALLRSEHLTRESLEPRLTMQGMLIGTPHYMAPEQLRSELVDARIDVYATGVVMYQMLTGSMPFDGSDLFSLTLNVLHGNAGSLRELRPDCPPRLARVIDRALERDPQRRFQSAASMLAALNAVEQQRASAATTYLGSLLEPLASRTGRLGMAAAVLGAWLMWSHATPAPSASVGRASLMASVTPARPELTLTQLKPEVLGQPIARRESSQLRSDDAPRSRGRVASASPDKPSERASATPVDAAKATTLSRKALALYLHGELAEAYDTFRKAARANPQEPTAFRGMGLSASRLGKTREARRAFHRYLELSPGAPDAELVRARLQELAKPAGL